MSIWEKIEVMKAFAEGKKIQSSDLGQDRWVDCCSPTWNWLGYDYRIKPEAEYRPYKNVMEMISDYCDRFKVDINKEIGCPFIWVKHSNYVSLITEFGPACVWRSVCEDSITLGELFKAYTYLDGSPCGIKEEA